MARAHRFSTGGAGGIGAARRLPRSLRGLLRPAHAGARRESVRRSLPASVALKDLARVARGRWPIEQHDRELKYELGLDHFEGRSDRGWTHPAALAALTYPLLQLERRRGTTPLPTFPEVRTWILRDRGGALLTRMPEWLNLLISFLRDPPRRM
jgi:hypothetical protein